MKIAILGATSQIAMDLTKSMTREGKHALFLYARRPAAVVERLSAIDLKTISHVGDFGTFKKSIKFDAIINFVGVGDPAAAVRMGASIFDVTLQFDQIVLDYLLDNPECRYLFLSSGAAYGGNFTSPPDENTQASIPINRLQPQDWYGVAKPYAECRHRALPDLRIIDIRVFSYFSRSQDIEARFLISEILRAIRDREVLQTSAEKAVRDFLHPRDFHNLIEASLSAPATNTVVDCYTLEPVEKEILLKSMSDNFGLRYEISGGNVALNATGGKSRYYSLNHVASKFGYEPEFTSLEGILMETQAIINSPEFHQKLKSR